MGKTVVSAGEGEFFQTTTLDAGSQSIAHGLGKTPNIVIAVCEIKTGGVEVGTNTATDLEINPASTGLVYTIYAK